MTKENQKSRFAQQWHYRPDVPLVTSPVFQLPFNIGKIIHWFVARWIAIGENALILGLASLTWFYLQPSLETTKHFAFGWIALMFLRNFILISIVAGGLHYFLHRRKIQQDELRFDPRPIGTKSGIFTLGNQTRDNMFWTLTSGIFFWTGFEVLTFWGMANGHIPILWATDNLFWFVAMILLTPLWISFHFYWIHRALHWPPLYKIAHSLHHRNNNIGPWSGLSMHPIEHAMFFSSVTLHWIIGGHPIVILFHMQHQALTAATSHAGYDALLYNNQRAIELGNFHHQMHHRYFECNYGSLEVPWDKVFGSFHDGTDEGHAAFLERRKAMMEIAKKIAEG